MQAQQSQHQPTEHDHARTCRHSDWLRVQTCVAKRASGTEVATWVDVATMLSSVFMDVVDGPTPYHRRATRRTETNNGQVDSTQTGTNNRTLWCILWQTETQHWSCWYVQVERLQERNFAYVLQQR